MAAQAFERLQAMRRYAGYELLECLVDFAVAGAVRQFFAEVAMELVDAYRPVLNAHENTVLGI